MIVEVIAVGTELLLGQIVNTNASDIGSRLADDGFDVHYQSVVGDNLDRIVASIHTACSRADAVILTGGIGPTQDDVTRDALCALLEVSVVRNTEHARRIEERIKHRGASPGTALKMADYPEGTEPLPNGNGVALGISAIYQNTMIFAVPGVPTEMRLMIDEQVRPRLRKASGEPAVLASRVLNCWGLGEARLAEMLEDLYESENPSIAFLVNASEVSVRITAKGRSSTVAESMIAGMESKIRDRLGNTIFATEHGTVDNIVLELLKSYGWRINVVEAATAGLVASRLSASAQFVRGTVVPTSSNDDVLDHAMSLLEQIPPDKAEVTIAISDASVEAEDGGISQREIVVAIRTPQQTTTRKITVLGDDERLRRFAVTSALHILRLTL